MVVLQRQNQRLDKIQWLTEFENSRGAAEGNNQWNKLKSLPWGIQSSIYPAIPHNNHNYWNAIRRIRASGIEQKLQILENELLKMEVGIELSKL